MAKRALLIGISRYESKLDGPLNDVEDWSSLAQQLGFEVEPPLLDEGATRGNIEERVRALFTSATNSGDHLLLFFSCHGTRVAIEGELMDGIVAFAEGKPTVADVVFDADLNQWIEESLEDGVKLTIIADCCHAEGFGDLPLVRAAAADAERLDKIRFMPIEVAADSHALRAAKEAVRHRGVRRIPPDATAFPEPLHLGATQKGAAAYEGLLGTRPRGYFSYALTSAIRESMAVATPPMTFLAAMRRADSFIARVHTDQSPTHRGPRLTDPFLA